MNKIITYNPIGFKNYQPSIFISDLNSVIKMIEKPENSINLKTIFTFMGSNPLSNYVIKYKDIEFYYFKVDDLYWEKINDLFPITYNLIRNSLISGRDVILHCRMGKSRSVTILVAFFLTCIKRSPELVLPFIKKVKDNWTDSIIFFIKQKREIIQPNGGFMEQLYDYENYLRINF
jgi:dual specificity phosphatase 12